MRKNYLYNLLLTVFNLLIPLASFPYIARVLGPEQLGTAQFVFLFCQYISIIAALGIPTYGTRQVARERHNPQALALVIKELLLINFGTGLILFILFIGAAFFIPYFQPHLDLYLCGSFLILFSFSQVDWLYTGLEKFRQMAVRSLALKSLYLIAVLLLVHDHRDTLPYLALMVISALAYNIINVWKARELTKSTGPLKTLRFRRHAAPLLFIFGTTVASTLYTTFDSVLLGLLSNSTSVGLYTAATKISKIIIPIIMAYGSVLLPMITTAVQHRHTEELKDALSKSYAYVVGLGIPASIGLFVFAPALVILFSGEAFSPAILTLRILSPFPFIIGLGYFWGYQVLLPLGKERCLMVAAVVGMIASLLLNFLLVPSFGQDGAAVAGVVAEILVTLAYFLAVRSSLPYRPGLKPAALSILSSAPFFVAYFLPPDFLAQSISITFAVFGIASLLIYLAIQLLVIRNQHLLSLILRPTVQKPER